MNTFLKEWIDRFLVPVDDPSSRLFHLNILTTLVLIVLWVSLYRSYRLQAIWQDLKTYVLNKKYWWNASTKIDYQIYFLNSILKVFLFIPFLDFSFHFSRWTVKALSFFTSQNVFALSSTYFNLLLFSIAAFVFDDFLRFIHHWLMHKVPFLWQLHKTHHSAKILTPVTLYRTHPLESAMATVRNSISTGVSVGFFIYFFESQMSIITILGINLFAFTFNLLGSNLRHSHIPLSFGFLEYLFISPKQHQIHHSMSAEHFNKNYGVSLSLWDGLFGSLLFSKNVSEKLRFGVEQQKQSLKSLLFGK